MAKPIARPSLMVENGMLYRFRHLVRHVPREPRCKVCSVPFAGAGRVFRLVGKRPSRKNPNLCSGCFEKAPLGGESLEIGVLFADVRGFTTLAESTRPDELADLLNRFYKVASRELIDRDAIIDKLVGDEVMALFFPAFTGKATLVTMVDAGEALLRAVGYGSEEPWLSLGVGAAYGTAFVGNVGSDENVKDFTAVGDVVNTASRLQAAAEPGQVVLAEPVYEAVRDRYPDLQPMELELKGKTAPVVAYRIDVGSRAPAAV